MNIGQATTRGIFFLEPWGKIGSNWIPNFNVSVLSVNRIWTRPRVLLVTGPDGKCRQTAEIKNSRARVRHWAQSDYISNFEIRSRRFLEQGGNNRSFPLINRLRWKCAQYYIDTRYYWKSCAIIEYKSVPWRLSDWAPFPINATTNIQRSPKWFQGQGE